jgi:hypothetical protein
MAQVGNIRLAHSGVPEFCHYEWRKSETSDLRTRVFPSSAIMNGASRKHPTCAAHAGYARSLRLRERVLDRGGRIAPLYSALRAAVAPFEHAAVVGE